MDRAKSAAYAELGLTALYLAAPGGDPQVDDLPERGRVNRCQW